MNEPERRGGPLTGLRVLEFAGLGPAPFCAMLLADLGASVVRIARPGTPVAPEDVTLRGRPTVHLDLRSPEGHRAAQDLAQRADALIEGFRPGVMERLGLGPQPLLALNPRLVYGRMTGWGQTGPLAHAAGHDLNYIALTGVLRAIGPADRPPPPPLNLIGDFGGGGMLLAVGLLAAVHEAARSGRGQVVDAAMTDGASLLSAFIHGWRAEGRWGDRREANLLDGGAPFYACYECADGRFVSVGPLEPAFYTEFRARCGLPPAPAEAGDPQDPSHWPALRAELQALFRSQPRAHWCERLEGTDACFAPVLDWEEAAAHPHNAARGTFIRPGGVLQPEAAPRFSCTPARAGAPAWPDSYEAVREAWAETSRTL